MLIARAIYIVEVSSVKEFKAIQEIAKKYQGFYVGKKHALHDGCFMFGKQANATAFVEECGEWPSYSQG